MTGQTLNPLPAREPASYERKLAWLFSRSRGGAPRDPERMRTLVGELDLRFPATTVHVVGTNGKGSVTTMVAAGATAAGRTAGAFTSPHVERFNERITVRGETIPDPHVDAFITRLQGLELPLEAAFFELTYAMALDFWRAWGVELGVVEAGVGARQDATLVTDNVALTLITPIAADHLGTLGNTIAEIALDKAAAMRPGVPAASAAQSQEVRRVLLQEAARQGTEILFDEPGSPLFEPPAGAALPADPVRRQNARLATAGLRLLGVGDESLPAVYAAAPLPARGEWFEVAGKRVLLDGAHDPAAAAALRDRAGGPYTLLFGALKRKQGEATLRELEGAALHTVVTRAAGEEPVPAPAGGTFEAEPARALELALALTPPGGTLVIGGSLYLAGELRPLLRRMAAVEAVPPVLPGG